MNLTEKTLKKEYQYQGKILKMRVDEVELPNGNTAKREVVEHPGGVTIAALTDDNELLFVRQFRYPYETVLLELPAGKLDPGPLRLPRENCRKKQELLEKIIFLWEHSIQVQDFVMKYFTYIFVKSPLLEQAIPTKMNLLNQF